MNESQEMSVSVTTRSALSPCYRCKVKKSKCDKTIPQCRRCVKAGVICPGYPEAGNTMFRTMNQYAERKVKTRMIRRAHGNIESPGASDAGSPMLPLSADYRELSLPAQIMQYKPTIIHPRLATNWHDVAIPRFMVDYIWPSHKVPGGSMNFLPEVMKNHPECRYLKSATQAVALISLANQNKQTHLLRDAEYHFLEAISGVASALEDIKQAKSDSVIATTFLFSIYAMLIDKPAHKYWNAEHHQGAISLLRLRGDSQFSTPMARNLYKMNHTQLMVTCLAAHIQPPDETDKWLEIIGKDEPSRANELAWCNLLGARFCANVQSLFGSALQDEQWVLDMLRQVREAVLIDQQLQLWHDKEAVGLWSQREVRSGSAKSGDAPTYVYHDLVVGFTWNYYRATRIHINEVLRHCVQLIQSHHSFENMDTWLEDIRQQSKETIEEMVRGICASTSFCLGEIDSNGNEGGRRLPLSGRAMLWPIYRAIRSLEEGDESQLWLIGKLQFISDVLGQKLAGRLLERPRIHSWDIR